MPVYHTVMISYVTKVHVIILLPVPHVIVNTRVTG